MRISTCLPITAVKQLGFPDKTKRKENGDTCKRGMMEKSALAEHAWENHHLIHWEETTVLDHGRRQELLVKEALRTLRGPLQLLRWRTGTAWLHVDHCDEETGSEELAILTDF